MEHYATINVLMFTGLSLFVIWPLQRSSFHSCCLLYLLLLPTRSRLRFPKGFRPTMSWTTEQSIQFVNYCLRCSAENFPNYNFSPWIINFSFHFSINRPLLKSAGGEDFLNFDGALLWYAIHSKTTTWIQLTILFYVREIL